MVDCIWVLAFLFESSLGFELHESLFGYLKALALVVIVGLVILIIFIPLWAVGARRLHDIGKSTGGNYSLFYYWQSLP